MFLHLLGFMVLVIASIFLLFIGFSTARVCLLFGDRASSIVGAIFIACGAGCGFLAGFNSPFTIVMGG